MRILVHRAARPALICTAILAFAAAVSTSRTVAQVEGPAPRPRSVIAPTGAPPANVVARRDPFAGGVAQQPRAPSGATPSPNFPTMPAMLAPLPANAGALATPVSFQAGRVSAVATGARPFALIDDGGATRLISVGDPYDGRHVTAIDGSGVHLDDRTLLPLTHTSSGTAAGTAGPQR